MNEREIRIPASHVSLLLEFYEKEISRKTSEMQRVFAEIKDMQRLVQDLKGEVGDKPILSEQPLLIDEQGNSLANEYDNKWPWIKKAVFALKHIGKPATTREILDKIKTVDASYHDKKEDLKAIGNLSSILGTKKKVFVRIKEELDTDNRWALHGWGYTDNRDSKHEEEEA